MFTPTTLLSFFSFFLLCYFLKTMTKIKKNQAHDKIIHFVVETFYYV
jgi:arginine exporter protein ArgO